MMRIRALFFDTDNTTYVQAKGAYIKMHYTDDLFGNKEYTFDVLSYGPLTYLKEEKKDNQKNNTSTKIYDGGRGENCNLCEE